MKKDITISNYPAYHSYPNNDQKHPGLIVIHEIWGLDAHIKNVADRFAEEGYSVIAPDLFHGMSFEGKIDQTLFDEMQNSETRDAAQKKMRELMAPMRSPEFAKDAVEKLVKCVDYLVQDEHVTEEIAVLGFCFGGTYAFHLAAHDKRIKATVPFYGQPPEAEEIPFINSPMLAFYGTEDERLIESLPSLKEAMKKNAKQFEAIVYEDTGHAFFNDTNKRMYRAHAAEDSWLKTLEFLKKNL